MYAQLKLKWQNVSKEVANYSTSQCSYWEKQAQLDSDYCDMEIYRNPKLPAGVDCLYWKYKKLKDQIKKVEKRLRRRGRHNQIEMFGDHRPFGLS